MSTYIITYDIAGDHQPMYDAIKKYGVYAHINESVWAVKTNESASDVYNFLKKNIQGKDSLFVVKSGIEAAWTNVICTDQWLKDNL